MAIRRSIKRRKPLWHHRTYGSIENPPFAGYPRGWPASSVVICDHVPRHQGLDVVVGWGVYLPGPKFYGVWLPTYVGVAPRYRLSGERSPIPSGKRYIEDSREQPGSYEFYSLERGDIPTYKLIDLIVDAFADKFGLIM